ERGRTMVARLWSARTTRAQAPAYANYLRTHMLPRLRQVAGYAGAQLLNRETGDAVEILVITWWQSRDAIRAFAGDDAEPAVVPDEAAAVLTEFDRRASHYEVIIEDRT